MLYSTRMVNQLAINLLEGLGIKNPTLEQCKAAECFVMRVILPPTEKRFVLDNLHLTPKEWICLNLAASGLSTEETAETLSLSKGTVKNYREHIRQKMRCKTIAQAVYKAFGH